MKPRRWFRFSLTTMFVVLTLCGVWLGGWLWLRENMRWIQKRHEMIETPELAEVVRDGNHAPSVPWSIRVLGEPGIAEIWIDPTSEGDRDALAKRAERLFPEAKIVRGFQPSFGGQRRAQLYPATH